jgi:transposase InsO family protein
MSWIATTDGISGEMIRDLMIERVERQSTKHVPPHPIEWRSDNGSCYRAHETISFAQSISFVPCFTPARSPQSKGMAESFVKTFTLIMFTFTIARMQNRSWRDFRGGSRTATKTIRTKPCE